MNAAVDNSIQILVGSPDTGIFSERLANYPPNYQPGDLLLYFDPSIAVDTVDSGTGWVYGGDTGNTMSFGLDLDVHYCVANGVGSHDDLLVRGLFSYSHGIMVALRPTGNPGTWFNTIPHARSTEVSQTEVTDFDTRGIFSQGGTNRRFYTLAFGFRGLREEDGADGAGSLPQHPLVWDGVPKNPMVTFSSHVEETNTAPTRRWKYYGYCGVGEETPSTTLPNPLDNSSQWRGAEVGTNAYRVRSQVWIFEYREF